MNFVKALFRPRLGVSEWLNNILFGLIMVLTTTALWGMRAPDTEDPDESPQSILWQVIGCNIAWGLINGGLLLIDRMYGRGKSDRLLRAVGASDGDGAAVSILEEEDNWNLDDVTSDDARRQLYLDVAARARNEQPTTMRLDAQDFADALWVCMIVSATVLPVVLSELSISSFYSNSRIGFLVGNILSLAIMFLVGYLWARETNVNRWLTATIVTLFGAAAVAVAWALGG